METCYRYPQEMCVCNPGHYWSGEECVLPAQCGCYEVAKDETLYHAVSAMLNINTLRPRQNGRHFADDLFKCIFMNENILIPIKISLKFVPTGAINNIPALVQIMAWRRPGHKPLSEPMMVSLPTHICVTWPQWVNGSNIFLFSFTR